MREAKVEGSNVKIAIKVFYKHLDSFHKSDEGESICDSSEAEIEILNAVTKDPHPNLMHMFKYANLTEDCKMRTVEKDGEEPDWVEAHTLLTEGTDVDEIKSIRIALPWCDRGSYIAYVMDHKPPANVVRSHFAKIVSAVVHLHHLGYCHRDISMANVLLVSDKTGADGLRVVLADFGSGHKLDKTITADTARPGKLTYIPPEVYQYMEYDGAAADIYSLGVFLFCALVGARPYNIPMHTDKLYHIIQTRGIRVPLTSWNMMDLVPPEAESLIDMMLCECPSKRPTIEEVSNHAWCTMPLV